MVEINLSKWTIIVYWTVTFQMNILYKAIKRLKCEKQDGVFNKLASEHFINAKELYYEHLNSLFIDCLKHGCMPNATIVSTLLPIPKGYNNLQNSQIPRYCPKCYLYKSILVHYS